MFKILDGREQFYQWDLNRKLLVQDASITEVHFCNKTEACSLVVEVKDGVADVPNILLQDNFRINVYGYDGEATKHCATFGIIARSKPADYIYTETEVKSYEDFRERLAANEEAITALGEEIENIDVTESIEEYVDSHIETVDVWSYSKANLETKRLHSLSSTSGERVLMINASKAFNTITNLHFLQAEIRLYVAEYYNRDIHSIKGVEHPFEVKVNPDTDFYAAYGRQNIVDVAVMLGDTDNIFTFSSIIEELVDGTTFTDGEMYTVSTRSGNDNSKYPLNVGMVLKIYSPYEQAIDGLLAEFSNNIANTTHALIYYKNTPPLNLIEGG